MALISTLVVALTARTTDFEQGLKSTEKMLDRVGGRIEDLGSTLAVSLTAPLLAAGGASVAMALQFEDSTSKLNTLLGLSTKETNGLRESVLKLAGETAQAPVVLGEALTKVEMAGLRGQAALDVVKASAMGATAGLGGVSSIANILTAQINAYGTSAMSAGRATAVLIDAVKMGRTTGDELAGSIGNLIPLASKMGVSFDQMVASIASMTHNGMEAGAAAMALRSILTTIEKPSAAAQKALGEVGLSADDLRDKIQSEGLGAALHTLGAALEGNDQAIAQLFPNARALSGVISLLGSQSKGTSDIFKTLANATEGDLNKSFEAATQTAGFKFKQAMVEVQILLIRIGDQILPTIVPLVQAFAGAVERLAGRFAELSPQARDLILVMAGIAASIGPALVAFSSLYTGAATAIGALRLFLSLSGLANLFQTVWVAVTALGAGMVELAGYFVTFGVAETVSEVILPGLAAAFFAVRGAVMSLTITPIAAFFGSLFTLAVDAGVAIAGLAATISGPAIVAFGLMAIAAGLIYSEWNELKTDLGVIFAWIVEEVKDSFVGKIISYITQFADYAAAQLTRFGVTLKAAVMPAVDGVVSGVSSMATSIKSGLGSAFDSVLAKAQAWAGGMVSAVHGAAAGIKPAVAEVDDGISVLKTTVIDARTTFDKFSDSVGDAFNGVKTTFTGLKSQMSDTGAAMQSQMNSLANKTASSIGAMTASFAQGKESIGQYVQQMIIAIGELIAKLLILQGLTAAGLGGPLASGFIGGLSVPGHADGGRPAVGQASVVGERGPELFIPDTAGTIVPNNALGGGGNTTVQVTQTFQVTGMDFSSAEAAQKMLAGLKDEIKRGTSDAITFAVRSGNLAAQNNGRSS